MNIVFLLYSFIQKSYAHYPNQAPNTSSVSLAISLGPVMNQSELENGYSFSGGFYTDIPLLETFHITPSTTIYRFNEFSQTNVSLSFKFLVPMQRFDLMTGLTAGLTSSKTIFPHVGFFGGITFPLISNLSWFVSANYLYQFDASTMHNISVNTGPLFRFYR